MWPFVSGLPDASKSGFVFNSASPRVYGIDITDDYAVSAGIVEYGGTTSFWPAQDVENDMCEGTGCATKPDWDSVNNMGTN